MTPKIVLMNYGVERIDERIYFRRSKLKQEGRNLFFKRQAIFSPYHPSHARHTLDQAWKSVSCRKDQFPGVSGMDAPWNCLRGKWNLHRGNISYTDVARPEFRAKGLFPASIFLPESLTVHHLVCNITSELNDVNDAVLLVHVYPLSDICNPLPAREWALYFAAIL